MAHARDRRRDGLDIRQAEARADGAAGQGAVDGVDETGRVGGLARDAEFEGAEAADAEPTFQAAHHAAEVLAVGEEFGEPGVIPHGEDAAEEVGVAADVFGAAVKDDVGAVEEGVLQRGWGEGRVDEEVGGAAVCEVRRSGIC